MRSKCTGQERAAIISLTSYTPHACTRTHTRGLITLASLADKTPYLAQPRRIPKASGARARLGGHSIKNGRRRSRATLSTHLVLRKWRGVLILFESQTHLIRITAFALVGGKTRPRFAAGGTLQRRGCCRLTSRAMDQALIGSPVHEVEDLCLSVVFRFL